MVVKTEKELSLCLCAVQRDWGEAEPLQTAVRTVVGQHSRLSRWWVTYSHLVLHNTAFNSRFSRVSHLSLWYSFFGYSHSLWAPQFKFLYLPPGGGTASDFILRLFFDFQRTLLLLFFCTACIPITLQLWAFSVEETEQNWNMSLCGAAIMGWILRKNWEHQRYWIMVHTHLLTVKNWCERKVTPKCFRVDTADVQLCIFIFGMHGYECVVQVVACSHSVNNRTVKQLTLTAAHPPLGCRAFIACTNLRCAFWVTMHL